MEFLYPAMWHDHDIDFARRLHPAMWHMAVESWQWIHQVAAPCNVIRGSGMTCHWIRPNVHHIGILHLVSIWTTSPQSTCHSVPVSEILSKSDHRQKKMTSCRSRWRISAILDFRDPIMGSLKSLCTTSYRSSIELLSFWENRIFAFWQQTDEQMDTPVAWSRSCCRDRLLNNVVYIIDDDDDGNLSVAVANTDMCMNRKSSVTPDPDHFRHETRMCICTFSIAVNWILQHMSANAGMCSLHRSCICWWHDTVSAYCKWWINLLFQFHWGRCSA